MATGMSHLARCPRCGELRGDSASCLCEGLVCGACGSERIHRPLTSYWDETAQCLINVPHFTYLRRCRTCNTRGNWTRQE
jgi:hypothetical protein